MKQFTLIFHDTLPKSKEEVNPSLARWKSWFKSLGSAVLDEGAPLKNGRHFASADAHSGGDSSISGYCVITAADADSARELISNCPAFQEGGTVEILQHIITKQV